MSTNLTIKSKWDLNRLQLTAVFIKVSACMERSMAMVFRSGRIRHDTKASGRMIKLMVKVPWCTRTATFMKATGLMIRLTVRELTSTPTALHTLETGLKTNSMGKVSKPGPMAPDMKEAIKMERKMVKVL